LNWLSTLGGVLAGLFGRELWEWLPPVTKALIWVATWPLSPERREVRRGEWCGELEHFKQRRISALLWALSLLPISFWEAATERGVFGRLGIRLQQYLLLYMALGTVFVPTALDIASRWGFSTPETVLFMAVAPVVIGCTAMIGVLYVLPVALGHLIALPVLLIVRLAKARSRRVAD
jgi:hypothetical protein